MPLKIFTFLILLYSFTTEVTAQAFKISGKVVDATQQPLSYVSVKVNNLQTGTVTNEEGNFTLSLRPGKYEFVFSLIGYKTQTVLIDNAADVVQNITLEDESKELEDVQVTVTKKDRAEEIIKNVIKQKEKQLTDAQTLNYNVYIKAIEESDPSKTIKVLSRPVKKMDDLSKMSMAEIFLKVDYAYPNKIKEERVGVKLRGKTNNLFFLTTTDGDFNFYKGLVKVPSVATLPILSPISYSGLVAYKFKTLNIRKEGDRKIYTIKITPDNPGNALVHGEVEVMDSLWVLLNTHFELPQNLLLNYDYFAVDQQYEFINNKAWLPVRQEFNYHSKIKADKFYGKTIAVYHNYKTDTTFTKNYFTTEVSSTAAKAYEQNNFFWEDVRRESLTEREGVFINRDDSVYMVTHSKAYLDSLDGDYNKITIPKIVFFGQGIYNRSKERTIILPPLLNVIKPFEIGGLRVAVDGSYTKIYPSKKKVEIEADVSFGFRNQDVKGNIRLTKLYNPFSHAYYAVYVGREFSYIYGNDSWISAYKRSNIYEKNEIGIENGVSIANGLYVSNRLEFAARNSIENYKFNNKFDTILNGTLINTNPVSFEPYNAFYNEITLRYTPHELYIREPNQKIVLGSKWPTFSLTWRKGIPQLFKSKINFDYGEFTIRQKIKLGLVGISEYSFITGSFLNKETLKLVDYKYMRRGDPFLFTEPSRNFQALDSTFAAFKIFYEGHYSHNFNGAIVNQIGFLKKLKLNEIVGGGFLFLPEKNLNYAEAFAGLEKTLNIFREKIKIGAYVVGSVANQYNNPVQFKFGLQYYNRTKKRWH